MKKFVCVHHDTMDGLCHGCAEKILNISGVEERVDEELTAANQRIKDLERENEHMNSELSSALTEWGPKLTASNQRIKELERVLEDHISKMIFWKQSTQNPDKFVIGNRINALKQSLPKESP